MNTSERNQHIAHLKGVVESQHATIAAMERRNAHFRACMVQACTSGKSADAVVEELKVLALTSDSDFDTLRGM